MPEFNVKEVRLPELHLPEIKRDEIARALSGVHLPEVDLTKAERRKLLPALDLALPPLRTRGLSQVDLGRLIAAAVAASRFMRPAAPRSRWSRALRSRPNLVAIVRPAPRRSRRRLALVALAVAAVAGWALLRDPRVRTGLDRAAAKARQRMDEMRAERSERMHLDVGEPAPAAMGETTPSVDDEVIAAQAEAAESSQQAINPA